MPKGYAITLTHSNAGGFTSTVDTFVQHRESTAGENAPWFPPDKNLSPSHPSLHLFYRLHTQDSLETMSNSNLEYLGEEVVLSSAEIYAEFEFEDSLLVMKICDPLGTLLFSCQIDGCSQESVPTSFLVLLPMPLPCQDL